MLSKDCVRQRTQTHSHFTTHNYPSLVKGGGGSQAASGNATKTPPKGLPTPSSLQTPRSSTSAPSSARVAAGGRPELWASLTLPIFMFDCTGSTLTSELLKKTSENGSGEGGEVGTSQSSVTLDATFDSKLLDANPTSSSVKVNSMDALALVDKHLRIHCINLLNAAYYKAFVQQTFKSLQGGYPVHQVWPLTQFFSVSFL